MKILLFVFLPVQFLLVYSSCQQSDSATASQQSGYFDMESFIHNEIGDTQSFDIIKLVYEDGLLVDSQKIRNYRPSRDLRTFRKADISAPASIGKYKVDTLNESNKGKTVIYEAIDDELNTRTLRVQYRNGKAYKIEMERRFNSLISSINQQAAFITDSMYDIRSLIVDKIKGDSNDLRVKVFLEPGQKSPE